MGLVASCQASEEAHQSRKRLHEAEIIPYYFTTRCSRMMLSIAFSPLAKPQSMFWLVTSPIQGSSWTIRSAQFMTWSSCRISLSNSNSMRYMTRHLQADKIRFTHKMSDLWCTTSWKAAMHALCSLDHQVVEKLSLSKEVKGQREVSCPELSRIFSAWSRTQRLRMSSLIRRQTSKISMLQSKKSSWKCPYSWSAWSKSQIS